MVLGGRNDRRRNPFFLTLLAAVLLLVFFTFSLPKRRGSLFILRSSEADQAASAGSKLELSSVKSKHAYATFLASDSEEDRFDSINEDKYFVATRILAYQLLHAPETRSNNSIPFVVLVNKHVSEAKRDRLRRDGAIVWEPKSVDPGWIRTGVPTWQFVLTKLRLWELVQFERICFLDGDTVLMKNLDSVFEEDAVLTSKTGNSQEALRDDEGKHPSDYSFAGIVEMNMEHHYPPTEANHDWPNGGYLNAGFFVMKPNLDMLEYYISLTKTPNRFEPLLPEQNLLNYAHRPEGNMPWKHLDTKWNMHYPTTEDIEGGVYSLHEKWWNPVHVELGPFLESWRWRMEGFWEGREADLRVR
ncbi:hypothetical protein TI39_contig1008g00007 [Zymoseptoria brevis]|uniref:Glycosyltransferase family 8 protein n=1 Tax=Zymoseptoria brevis TaxID=1047168 RepID=A0A0F4GI31_9PEZI|nr:hypothetical protein TI39_contig1008g00007 [Zymoseptoria brevis]